MNALEEEADAGTRRRGDAGIGCAIAKNQPAYTGRSPSIPHSAFRIPHSIPSAIILLALIFSLASPRFASAQAPMSVRDFMAQEAQWDSFVKLEKPLKIEGRCSSHQPRLIMMAKCPVPFRPRDVGGFSKLLDTTKFGKTIEVEGLLKKRMGKWEFVVDHPRQLPSDEQTFSRKKQDIAADDSAGWYALGDWAVARGSFYEDEKLTSLAPEAYQKGFDIEYRKLAGNDATGRRKILKRIDDYKLPRTLYEEIVHEIYRIDWDAFRAKEKPDFTELINNMGKGLVGALEVPKSPQPDLEKQYHAAPLQVFRAGGLEARKRLNRIFYADVVLATIEKNAQPDGRNGYTIAERIDEKLPEKHDLAENYRNRELEFKLSQISTATQQQAVELSKLFADRGKPEKGRTTREAWLAAKAKDVPLKDTERMLFLAEQYEALLGDKATAVALLLKAYAERPESADLSAALTRQGYTLADGKWLPARDVKNIPPDPTEQAIREGRVSKGMTTEQVQKALGRPTSITRIATAREVSEVWIYREQAVNRVIIQFSRPPGPNAKSTVVSTY